MPFLSESQPQSQPVKSGTNRFCHIKPLVLDCVLQCRTDRAGGHFLWLPASMDRANFSLPHLLQERLPVLEDILDLFRSSSKLIFSITPYMPEHPSIISTGRRSSIKKTGCGKCVRTEIRMTGIYCRIILPKDWYVIRILSR